MVPTIKRPSLERDGTAVFQCMLTEGSSACVPESSMVIDFAWAADAQIMLNA
jgi:hypothetical protein